MPMHAITIVPTLRTVGWTCSSAPHAACGTVQSILSLQENRRQFPDSSTEDSYLSVLKNNVSDTRGLNFYCRRFLQGFSSGFLVEQFLRTSELVFLNPSNSTMFSYDSRKMKA